MIFSKCDISDLLILEPKIFGDSRGYFLESFNQKLFNEACENEIIFVQDNESQSSKNVLRGLHMQAPPFSQGKLVRVIKGSVLDVAVDLRKNSKTYGHHFEIELSEKNKKQLWIPPGFAHGFETLEDDTIFAYKCTNYYDPESELTILWNDEDLKINWRTQNPILSLKDQKGKSFLDFESPY